MSVARLGAAASVADATTLAYAISAGSNRALIVAVAQEEDGTLEVPTVSYGLQALTQVSGAGGIVVDGGTQAAVHFYLLIEAGLVLASDTLIRVAGATLTAKAIHAASYQNVNQSTPVPASAGVDYEETGGALQTHSSTARSMCRMAGLAWLAALRVRTAPRAIGTM